ncbi:unnamed protein product [Rotaria socialis]|uniref:Uncharacterized protein n=1 Tax=Rotaria socialis TaxID=392032 RepID=A0A817NPU5_9BILA|nr:unnamed protein product [Rotaria socialis]CAF3422537.1 unnamed protein product [Rotaria socialis]CAF4465005.1 unnamed protein product [Rotaria socialis]CAF4535635.1 unnamed protein product [Rotaria socialis]CAF4875226.1 unnamed protein product [Rotaria socialis]
MARILLRKQVILAEKYLPFDHPKQHEYLNALITLYESHGLKNQAFRLAFFMLKKQERDFGKTHSRVAQTMIAMGNFNGACRILLQDFPIDEIMVMKCFHLLSQSINKDKGCIIWLKKWLAYLELNYPSIDRRIAYTLRQMASIYYDLEYIDLTFDYLRRSLHIYTCNQDHFNMRIIEDFMRHIKEGIGKLHNAYVICNDYWEIQFLFCDSIDNKLIMPAPPHPTETYKSIQA